MNKSRKRALSLALALCLTLGMFTGLTLTAGAAATNTLTPGNTITDDNTIADESGNNSVVINKGRDKDGFGNKNADDDDVPDKNNVTDNYDINDSGIFGDPLNFTVKFDSQGGSPVPYVKVSNVFICSIIEPDPAPTKSGYVFAGWYKDAACTNPWNFKKDKVTGNMTLYAKWELAIKILPDPVTIYFAGDTHTAIVSFPSVYTGLRDGTWTTADKKIATVSADKDGHGVVKGVSAGETILTFTHTVTGATAIAKVIVKSNASDSNKDSFKSTKSTKSRSSNNIGQTPIYTVKFDLNGGQDMSSIGAPYANQFVSGGSVITLPEAPSMAGHTFIGWYDGNNRVGDQFEPYTVTKNVTLTAHFVLI